MAAESPGRYVGAIDQGTTSTRFMIFDHDGHEVGKHQLEHEQILPQAGWVEHDPHEIWEATQDVITRALGKGAPVEGAAHGRSLSGGRVCDPPGRAVA